MRWQESLLNILFPPVCVHCHNGITSQQEMLCGVCARHIERFSGLQCPVCHARVPSSIVSCHSSPYLLAAACAYQGPIPSLLYHYKYRSMQACGLVCAALLIIYIDSLDIDISSYTFSFIPAHPSKIRSRGFNQSYELARMISDHYHRPLVSTLTKVRLHKPQMTMKTWDQRHTNIANSFALLPSVDINRSHIILVDDVSTSGATLQEASSLLRSAGARRVVGLVLASAS